MEHNKSKHASLTKYTTTQNEHRSKTKAKFRPLLRPPAWKRNGSILKEAGKYEHNK